MSGRWCGFLAATALAAGASPGCKASARIGPASAPADAGPSLSVTVAADAFKVLSEDRRTVWNPGRMSVGGIPVRSTVCARLAAAAFGDGARDATAGIQAAIEACPPGQVVLLSAGTFTVNDEIVLLNKGVTLRGAGPTATLLRRTNGATQGSYKPGVARPLIIVGTARWGTPGSSHDLAVDAGKGATSVNLASGPPAGLSHGQIVLIDELSGASWQSDPAGRGRIWAAPDFR